MTTEHTPESPHAGKTIDWVASAADLDALDAGRPAPAGPEFSLSFLDCATFREAATLLAALDAGDAFTLAHAHLGRMPGDDPARPAVYVSAGVGGERAALVAAVRRALAQLPPDTRARCLIFEGFDRPDGPRLAQIGRDEEAYYNGFPAIDRAESDAA